MCLYGVDWTKAIKLGDYAKEEFLDEWSNGKALELKPLVVKNMTS